MSKYSVIHRASDLQPLPTYSATQQIAEFLISAGYLPSEIVLNDIRYEAFKLQLGLQIQDENRTSDHEVHHAFPTSDLYVIARGKVRLLGFDDECDRWITLSVLETGDWFGADFRFFSNGCLPYQAVGASEGTVYRLNSSTLSNLLNHYPNLEPYLAETTRTYQRVAFYRTQSSIKHLPGRKIRELAPKVTDQLIPAQTFLASAFQDQPGIYWLRSGIIHNHQGDTPSIGAMWQGGSLSYQGWVAMTDLVVHYLPSEALDEGMGWEQLLSTTASSDQAAPGANGLASRTSELAVKPTPIQQPLGIQSGRQVDSIEHPTKPTPENPPTVIFPKPLKRKVLDRFQRFPWIEQQSSSDCGAACLAMIARYWGKRLPIKFLREKANVERAGASLKSLARGAESIGFHARPVRASFGRIAAQTDPWIAHWQGDHYVVVYQVRKDRVVVADPALDKRSISKHEFQAHWTGYALLLSPTERLREVEVKQASLGRYIKLLVPYQSLIFQILVVSLLIQVFSLITPLFTQIILDKVVVQKSTSTLNVFAIGLLMFSAWAIVMTTVRSYLLAYFSMRLDLTMISGFIRHALSLPLKFYESRRVGDIITRVQENEKIQRFLVGQMILAWLGVLTGFVYLALMLYYNLQLTLMVLALIPPIVAITLISTPFLRRISREVFKEDANQNSTLVEMMNGIAAVKSAGVEHEVRWRWENALTQFKNVAFKGQKFGVGLAAINGTVNTLGSTALLWLGAAMVIQDQLTIGQFVAFNMMIGYVLSPIVDLADLWDELQEIFISVERLNDVFETPPEEPIDQPMLVLPVIQGSVLFDKVTFRYGDDAEQNTLENLSFQVEPGQTIAVVGRSGSGKTTLVKLLEGLYHTNKGRILVDGHDIQHVSPHSLRTQLGVVPQECFLFSGTILENITLYRYDFSLEQAIEAAKLAEAHPFIQELPLGYNTKIGERGSTLSGGQRQRIAIARALLGDPRILILDEATSSLDTESERRFQRNLERISRDRTTFIIAHRLSTVRNADRILVLDSGILVEQGNHQELLEQRGLYYSLAQQQLDL
ncbi:MAG: peptidase domain-containing ABC transporter [Leptolyngbya sp. SIO1E4]|nr:peptidase domain-containing ABC transporter [Leptolyngbya sp. SIO1E4]